MLNTEAQIAHTNTTLHVLQVRASKTIGSERSGKPKRFTRQQDGFAYSEEE